MGLQAPSSAGLEDEMKERNKRERRMVGRKVSWARTRASLSVPQ